MIKCSNFLLFILISGSIVMVISTILLSILTILLLFLMIAGEYQYWFPLIVSLSISLGALYIFYIYTNKITVSITVLENNVVIKTLLKKVETRKEDIKIKKYNSNFILLKVSAEKTVTILVPKYFISKNELDCFVAYIS